MRELDYKESWAPKNWCFWTAVLEKTLESPLDCKEIQPVHPKGDQSWVFTGRTDAEAEPPILWPPDVKSWLTGKDPDAGKDWRQEEKGMTEDEMVGWHHGLNGHEFRWTPGVGDGQGGLACCSAMGSQRFGHDWVTELNWLNWTDIVRGRKEKINSGKCAWHYNLCVIIHIFFPGYVWIAYMYIVSFSKLLQLSCLLWLSYRKVCIHRKSIITVGLKKNLLSVMQRSGT